MLGKLCNLLVISVFFTCCLAVDVTDFKRSFSLDCDSQYNPLCFKMDIAAFIERLSTSPELILTPSVSIVRDGNATSTKNSEIIAELSRSFPNDPSKRMDGFLFSKLSDYLQSHTLRFRLWDNKSSLEDAKAAFTGRKGKNWREERWSRGTPSGSNDDERYNDGSRFGSFGSTGGKSSHDWHDGIDVVCDCGSQSAGIWWRQADYI
uniref:Putative secreted protein n=1 Tax=Lutzomyia longipalpis TaxID=7200 RepID=A0A7G3AGT3_LUTLO